MSRTTRQAFWLEGGDDYGERVRKENKELKL
jgi:hypothetical protein